MSENQVVESTTLQLTEVEIASLKKLLADYNKQESADLFGELGKSSEAITELVKGISTLHSDGTLNALLELAIFVDAVKRSFTTDIIVKMTSLIPEPKMLTTLERVIEVTKDTKEIVDNNPNQKVGIGALLKALKDPDMQYLLNYLLVFSKGLAKAVKE